MWGIIPAAGAGSRIQPLAFSKELLPVGSRYEGGIERPRAVSEYLIERMVIGGATKICFVISPGKSDIMEYYGSNWNSVTFSYVVQPNPSGLCDALFKAMPLIGADEELLFGLPDTIWFPTNGFCSLPNGAFSFLLFPVEHPEFFDAVVFDETRHVLQIQVKQPSPASHWIWGAFKMTGRTFSELHRVWQQREKRDEYLGTLVNEYLNQGGEVLAIPSGKSYADVGTFNGYRAAIKLLAKRESKKPHEINRKDPETSLLVSTHFERRLSEEKL